MPEKFNSPRNSLESNRDSSMTAGASGFKSDPGIPQGYAHGGRYQDRNAVPPSFMG